MGQFINFALLLDFAQINIESLTFDLYMAMAFLKQYSFIRHFFISYYDAKDKT